MWIGPVHAAEHTLVGLGVIDTLVGGCSMLYFLDGARTRARVAVERRFMIM